MTSDPAIPRAAVPESEYSASGATATLPFVRRVAKDAVDLTEKVSELARRYAALKASDETDQAVLNQTRSEMRRLEDELGGCAAELTALGARLGDARRGEVDFPARLEGDRVLLCWHVGEEQVEWWHGEGQGFAERRPLPVPVHADS